VQTKSQSFWQPRKKKLQSEPHYRKSLYKQLGTYKIIQVLLEMASPCDDSSQLQKSTSKAAKSPANGTKEMPQKQPLEYVFQPGEQIIVAAKIGKWPGIVSCILHLNFLFN
jgi:hypothetical protein